MPRKAINYSKCMFYRLVCKDVTVNECYVGHTTNEKNRRKSHKCLCTNEKAKFHNLFVYRFIRDHGGWENWQLIVHEKLAVKDKAAAVLRERYWLEHYNATLNTQVPGHTHAESNAAWYAAHIVEIKAYQATYNAAHVDEKKVYNAAYREVHADKINAHKAEYRADNADKIKVYQSEKHTCECGGKYTTCSKSRHFKCAKHLAFAAK